MSLTSSTIREFCGSLIYHILLASMILVWISWSWLFRKTLGTPCEIIIYCVCIYTCGIENANIQIHVLIKYIYM